MTEHELFQKTFSTLHASPDTLMEVQKTMENSKKTHRTLRRGAVIAIAAALTLTVAAAAGVVTLINANVSPADKVDDTTYHAFTDDMDATTPTVEDGRVTISPSPIWSASPAIPPPRSGWWGSISASWTPL